MDGGQRHWNEESQRWEKGAEDTPPVTPPPPPRPDQAPAPLPPGPARTPDATTTAHPPTAEPYPLVEPGCGHRRRTMWTSVLAAVAAIGVAASLAVMLAAADGDGDGNEQVTAASTSATPEPSPTAPETEPSTPDTPPTFDTRPPLTEEPPAGYVVFDDPEGFRIAVPENWTRTAVGSEYGMDVVNYRSPEGGRKLQVFEVAESSPDESLRLFLSFEFPKPDGFVQLSLTNLDDGEFTGSLLEYAADSLGGEPDIGTWHVFDLRFIAADDNIYAVAAYGPDADGADDELQLLATALAWFCPPYTTCGEESAALDTAR